MKTQQLLRSKIKNPDHKSGSHKVKPIGIDLLIIAVETSIVFFFHALILLSNVKFNDQTELW